LISKNEIKFVTSLHRKKGREANHLYIVEGVKLLSEAVHSGVKVTKIFTTDSSYLSMFISLECEKVEISKRDMERITAMNSASPLLAIIEHKKVSLSIDELKQKRFLMLDGLRDPGNLGTIIRSCEWFGITDIVASEDTVDVFNNKVIQSTMGSFFRVNVHYTDLRSFLQEFAPWKIDFPVYAAVLGGDSLKETLVRENTKGCVVIGSESHGISENVQSLCSHKITISGSGKAESLNAAISASIILYEWFS